MQRAAPNASIQVSIYGFETAASFDPDSSFVKVAYDQGFLVLVLFAGALLTLLLALALRALEARNPLEGGRALASCGALAAFGVAMSGANYFESLVAVGPWALVAIGSAGFIHWHGESR